MKEYLILRLQGAMQAWGGHTYEDYRPSGIFPTRSGLVGLIGACLGIDRKNRVKLQNLSDSFIYAVRSDTRPFATHKITDFHTVKEARRVDRKEGKNPIVSRREYLCDACFTVALKFAEKASFSLEEVRKAIAHPCYTPVLGRRSCPIGRPLFEKVLRASNLLEALSQIEPAEGVVYSEQQLESANRLVMRDVPSFKGHRQFATRAVFIHAKGGPYVSE